MNRDKAQQAINKIIEAYRNENGKAARNQYPVTKKQIDTLTELGILEMVPNAPYAKTIGSTEAKLIIEAANASSHSVGGFNNDYEGDGVMIDASDLYKALHEVEPQPEPANEITVDQYIEKYGIESDVTAVKPSTNGLEILTNEETQVLNTIIGELNLLARGNMQKYVMESAQTVRDLIKNLHRVYYEFMSNKRAKQLVATVLYIADVSHIRYHEWQRAKTLFMREMMAYSEAIGRTLSNEEYSRLKNEAMNGNGWFTKKGIGIPPTRIDIHAHVENGVVTEAFMKQVQGEGGGFAGNYEGLPLVTILKEGFKPSISVDLDEFVDMARDEYADTHQQPEPDLYAVMTTKEVSEVFGIEDATVRQTIARNAIPARKSGSTWLILRKDAEKQWGHRIQS